MVFFNYALRKLNAKIVYYGPGLCGKTTNLQWVHDNFEGGDKGKMVSLATEGDRTIFFDLLPLDIGKIRGMDVTLQLYTVPGQVHYNSTRQLVLRGADGVVFVADSQRAMQSSNIDSLKNLDENLGLQGVNLAEFPHVIQFNKRDLGELMAIEEMDAALNRCDAPFFESVAVEGIGVQETLEGIVRLVMRSLKGRYEARGLGVEPSRLRPAGVPANMPVPGVDSPQPTADLEPPPYAEIPAIPGPAADEISVPEAIPAPPTFDIEKEPEAVTLETPPPPAWDQPTPDQPTMPPQIIEQTPDPSGEGTPAVESAFETPSLDVGPPDGDEAEIIEDLEPVPFEEVDTQTGMLVPPSETEEFEAVDAEPADLLPEGPGKPFEADEQAVGVAQYDTADVGEFPASFRDDRGGDFDEPVADREAVAAGDRDEIGTTEGSQSEGEEFTPEEMTSAVVNEPTGHDVDDLVAAVLGDQGAGDSKEGERDLPGAFDQMDEIPEEIGTEDQTPEKDVFKIEPESILEAVEEQVPSDNAEDQGIDDSNLPAEPDDAPAVEVAAGPFEMNASEPLSRPLAPTPVVFDDGDPFVEAKWDESAVEPQISSGVLMVDEGNALPVSVSAENNSLAVKLSGTGAIVESGEMRELDIEVPVPGTWVGNRKVTLQLRLTLLPVSEDENDGTNNPA